MTADDILRRVPPQNLEAEQSVLGAILLEPPRVAEASAIVEIEDFYRESHRAIFAAMLMLEERHEPIDTVTLAEELRGQDTLEASGGPGYLAELAAAVPTAANIEYYARKVREKAVLRRLISTLTERASGAFECYSDAAEFLAETASEIASVCDESLGHRDMTPLAQSVALVAEEVITRTDDFTKSGFKRLDRLLQGGLHRGLLYVLAARPSAGKSALAMNILTAVSRGGSLLMSNEMSRPQLLRRAAAGIANINFAEVRARGRYLDAEMQRLRDAVSVIEQMKIDVRFERVLRPRQVRAWAFRSLREWEGKLDLLAIDYLQLMEPDRKGETENQEIGSITRSLKLLASELQCPVLLVSQLNRGDSSGRGQTRPRLSDLRGSGSIEQDADAVIFLWRDALKPGETEPGEDEPREINVTVEKQRDGPVGSFRLRFDPPYTLFTEPITFGTS